MIRYTIRCMYGTEGALGTNIKTEIVMRIE
jgi:hypothetical protein